MNFNIGDTVGGYEIVGILGSGGMGEVYRVRNVISDRVDAMKVLLAGLQRERDFATRFLREIKVQARLVHPNIAQLYTAFENQGNLMMILELIEGMSLADMLQRGRIPLVNAIDYASQALTALSYAHQQGVIHRDIKPGNIMVTRVGAVKLMDFGIAKAASDHTLTITGNLIGSLYYMSPEQVRAEALDGRADLYSLGIVLYQMATGKKPFDGGSEYTIMRAHVEQLPLPPRSIDASLPEELNQVILRALEKDPAARFQSGEEFRIALQQVASRLWQGQGSATRVLASPPPVPEESRPEVVEEWLPRAAPPVPETAPRLSPLTASGRVEANTPEDELPVAIPVARSRTSLWIAVGVATALSMFLVLRLFDSMTNRPATSGAAPTGTARSIPDTGPVATVPAVPAAAQAEPTTPSQKAPERAPVSPPASPRPAASSTSASLENATPIRPASVQPAPSRPTSRSENAAPVAKATDPPSGVPPVNSTPPPQRPSTQPIATTQRASTEPPLTPPAPSTALTETQPATVSPGSTESPLPPTPGSQAPPPRQAAAPPTPSEERVYDPKEVDTPPKLLRRVHPLYTQAARTAGIQGRVRLEAEIWPDGRAHNVRVVQSIGHPDLDHNAVAALSQWQFAPGRKDGAAVKVRAIIDQNYRLQGNSSAPALTKEN